jgi:hypothetical protein
MIFQDAQQRKICSPTNSSKIRKKKRAIKVHTKRQLARKGRKSLRTSRRGLLCSGKQSKKEAQKGQF